MQGNERNNDLKDAEFMDFAWSEMSKQLDQEMPVNAGAATTAPRKRYGLLLLCLVIGFASGIGTMLFVQQEAEIKEVDKAVPIKLNPREVAASSPTAMVEPSRAETDQLSVSNQQNQSIGRKIKTSLSKKSTKKTLSNNQTANVADKKLHSNSSSVVAFDQSQNSRMEHPLGSPSSSHENIILLDTEVSKPVQLNETTALSEDNRKVVAIDLLNSGAIPLLDLPSKAIKLERLQNIALPKMSYGIYLGSHTRHFKGMDGLSTGVYASYQLDDKFSIRSGLGYSLIKGFQLETPGFADPLTADFFEPLDDDENISAVSSLRNNQDLPVQSLHYLDLPVALNYRMSSKVGILMGVKLSYLINAKTDGYFSNSLNEEEADLLDDALYDSMRKMDFATVLGFGVYPSSKLGLELKYNHGFVDYTIDEKWHVRQLNSNKTFELSVHYSLK